MRSGRASRYGLRTLALGYLLVLLALPFSAIVYYTFQDGVQPVWEALTDESFVAALKLTLIAVLIAVPANTIFGVACAMALVRRPPKHGTWLINSLIGLPLALSPVVVGLALILVYGQDGWLGSWLTENGIQIIFSTPGIVLATIFVTLPFVVREVIPCSARSGPIRTRPRGRSARRAFRPSARHAPGHPLGRRLRRRPHDGAGPRGVRRRRGRLRAHRRQDRDAHAARGRVPALQRGRRVRRPSCSRFWPCSP